MNKIGIIMGSDSDLPIAEKAIEKLAEYGINYEVHVYSAHRTPEETIRFAKEARQNGFDALIGIAGKAAHRSSRRSDCSSHDSSGHRHSDGKRTLPRLGCASGNGADAAGNSGGNRRNRRCCQCSNPCRGNFSGI